MAANITAAFAGSELGPENPRGSRTSDIISLTGGGASAVGDTLTAVYRGRNVHRSPQVVDGAFSITNIVHDLAGVTFDLVANVALAGRTVFIEVRGEY